ncbi:MAG: ribosome biogenesis GTPase Der [Firmicutes bacterium]|nr:ribosome biogenesis GTPase Der [Bacillota bacterium]
MALVAIVGRPNVGKSALFNRLTQTRRAIVADVEGVTRDRLYEVTDWNGQSFTVVDTGGIWEGEDNEMLAMTRAQTLLAIDEADVLVMVVDGTTGVTAADEDVARLLRRARKPVLVVVNKAEGKRAEVSSFYALGLGDPIPVSAIHGEGIGDLLDAVVARLPSGDPADETRSDFAIRVAIAGRPNVGKSSLVNWLAGTERTLVTPIAGTTRDVVDTRVTRGGREYLFLDTAGLRRPNRVQEALESKTVQRSLQAIRQSDVVLLMLDASEGVFSQDQRIAGQIEAQGKATVVLLNKADLVKGTTVPMQQRVRDELRFLSYARILPISVLNGWRLEEIWSFIDEAYAGYTRRLPTHVVNRVVDEAVHLNPPPSDKHGRQLKIYYATQVSTKPPHVVLFVNDPDLSHFSYERYLEHRLREAADFRGTPVRITLRARRQMAARTRQGAAL